MAGVQRLLSTCKIQLYIIEILMNPAIVAPHYASVSWRSILPRRRTVTSLSFSTRRIIHLHPCKLYYHMWKAQITDCCILCSSGSRLKIVCTTVAFGARTMTAKAEVRIINLRYLYNCLTATQDIRQETWTPCSHRSTCQDAAICTDFAKAISTHWHVAHFLAELSLVRQQLALANEEVLSWYIAVGEVTH